MTASTVIKCLTTLFLLFGMPAYVRSDRGSSYMSGSSVPSWLLKRGPVLIKRQARSSKTDALVDEVKLLQANSHFAYARFPDGRETTVSTKQLVPPGQEQVCQRV